MTPIGKITLAWNIVKYSITMYKWLKAENFFRKQQGGQP